MSNERWEKGYDFIMGSIGQYVRRMFIYENIEDTGCCEGVYFSEIHFNEQPISHEDRKQLDRLYSKTKLLRVLDTIDVAKERKYVSKVVDQEGAEGVIVVDWSKGGWVNHPQSYEANAIYIPAELMKDWFK